MGGPACRWPGVTRSKPFKRFNIFLACLIPQPTGTPRPHQWLLIAVLHRKLVPTHRSMVYLPCLHVTGHIPFASGANVNIRFFLHNAVLHRKLVPTHRSMVYLPCLHVTGHIPFASGANINVPFRNDLRVPHLETVTTCAPVIYLARAYTARHRLLASGTNILETLAFPRCFCFICQQRHRLMHRTIIIIIIIIIILIIINQTCTAPTTFSPTPQKGGRRHPGASPFYYILSVWLLVVGGFLRGLLVDNTITIHYCHWWIWWKSLQDSVARN